MTWMRFESSVRLLLITITSVAFLEASAQQTATILIPFQGRLADSAGAAVPDGTQAILFQIYDAPSGGNVVWPGEVHQTSVKSGLVNVELGTKAEFGENFDFSRQLYLEVTVDVNNDGEITAADPPMLPRQVITPVPHAVSAQKAKDIEDNTITSEKIVDDSVTADDLAADASSLDKMSGGKINVSGGHVKIDGLTIETRTSDPESPETGRIWLRTDL